MARWAQDVYLMHSTDGTAYTKLIDIKDYPDMGAEPNLLQTTTLSETRNHTYILGLQDISSFSFTANYSADDYQAMLAIQDRTKSGADEYFALYFGTAGEDGILRWSGALSTYVIGKGVDEVAEMSVITSVGSEIEFDVGTAPANP